MTLKYIAVGAFLVFTVGYFAIMTLKFKEFCQKIAAFENRLEDLNDIRRDEGGLNRFELEIFRNISASKYDDIENVELRQSAHHLRKKLTVGYFFAFVLVVLFALLAH